MGILAQVATIMDENKDHMCYECGNIYFEARYKIVKVPAPGHAEEPAKLSVKTEYELTAPKKPVR